MTGKYKKRHIISTYRIYSGGKFIEPKGRDVVKEVYALQRASEELIKLVKANNKASKDPKYRTYTKFEKGVESRV